MIAKPIRLLETVMSIHSNGFMKKRFAVKYFRLDDDGCFLKQGVCFEISILAHFNMYINFLKVVTLYKSVMGFLVPQMLIVAGTFGTPVNG